jgi:hypothetical protein
MQAMSMSETKDVSSADEEKAQSSTFGSGVVGRRVSSKKQANGEACIECMSGAWAGSMMVVRVSDISATCKGWESARSQWRVYGRYRYAVCCSTPTLLTSRRS